MEGSGKINLNWYAFGIDLLVCGLDIVNLGLEMV